MGPKSSWWRTKGTIYFSGPVDATNGDILKYTLSGAVSTFNVANETNGVVNPNGIARADQR